MNSSSQLDLLGLSYFRNSIRKNVDQVPFLSEISKSARKEDTRGGTIVRSRPA
jgi:hypothetical protein